MFIFSAGAYLKIGDITYSSPRDGPTVWEIGIPDRTASGFFIPDPNPKYINRLYINSPQKWVHCRPTYHLLLSCNPISPFWEDSNTYYSGVTKQVAPIWAVGAIHRAIPNHWPCVYCWPKWLEKRLVLCTPQSVQLLLIVLLAFTLLESGPIDYDMCWLRRHFWSNVEHFNCNDRKCCVMDGRMMPDGTYVSTTWQVKFNLDDVSMGGVYKFRMAFAASSFAAIQVELPLQLYKRTLSSSRFTSSSQIEGMCRLLRNERKHLGSQN